jgi:hypothetical protein
MPVKRRLDSRVDAVTSQPDRCIMTVIACREHPGRAAFVLMRCRSACPKCDAVVLCQAEHQVPTVQAPAPTAEQLAILVERVDIAAEGWPETRDALAAAIEAGTVDYPDTRRDLADRLRRLPATAVTTRPADTYPGLDDH